MGWKAVATVIIVVFVIVITQMVMAGPIVEISNSLNETGNYSNEHFDGNQTISDMPSVWFNMGLIGIFGIMAWGVWRIIRREITRRGGGL